MPFHFGTAPHFGPSRYLFSAHSWDGSPGAPPESPQPVALAWDRRKILF